jgi:hypothetical protein
MGAFIKHITISSTVATPNTTKNDCFLRRNPTRQDSYPLRLTKKRVNRNNTSVLALRSNQAGQGHYSLITPRRRKKKKLTKAEDGGVHDNGSYDNEGSHDDGWYHNEGPYNDGLYDDGSYDDEGLYDGGGFLDDGSFDNERPKDNGTDYEGGLLDGKGLNDN